METKLQTPQTNTSRKRILFFDILRILSIMMIVMAHVIAMTWYLTDVNSFTWRVYATFKCACFWTVPVFTMISGALFLGSSNKKPIKKIYTHNIRRLLLAFFFWAAVYAVIFGLKYGSVDTFLEMLFLGDYHMWFIFMIIAMYMLSPIFKKITEEKSVCEYFLVLMFVFVFVLPQLFNLLTMVEIPYVNTLFVTLQKYFDQFVIYMPSSLVFYFILGEYLMKTELCAKTRKIIYILGIAGYLVTVLLTILYSTLLGEQNELFTDFNTVNTGLLAIAIFTFGKYELSRISISQKAEKWILILSDYSLGIYFIHVLVLKTIYGVFDLALMPINPFVTCILIPPVMFAICTLAVMVIKKIPILKKFV